MFGVDPNQIKWLMQTIAWIVKSLQAIAAKQNLVVPDPPAPPES